MRLVNLRLPVRGRQRRSGLGQSLVEFALILPVIMLLLVITIDFGRIFVSYVSLNNTVRVAANYGSLNPVSFTGTPSTTTYDQAVDAESGALAATCPIRAVGAYNPPIPTYPSGTGLNAVSVATMTCDFAFMTPFVNGFFGGALPISATAQFPVRAGALASIGGGVIPVPGAPVAAFSFTGNGFTTDAAGNASGNDPVQVGFLDGSSNAQTWDWSFGDATADYTTDAKPPSHTYALGGSLTPLTFTVRLTVTNTVGSSTATHTVTVNPTVVNPVAGFYGNPVGTTPQVSGGGPTGAPINGTASTTVNFVNTSVGGLAYSWNFGDGTPPSLSATPSHTYGPVGVYTVTLSITAPPGSTAFPRSNYVNVGCVIPIFSPLKTDTAAATYAGAGLTGTLWYQAQGRQNASKTPPPTPSPIVSQTGQPGGNWVPPTKSGNQPYGCNYDVTVIYQ